ncbi:MAG: propionyl-CoA carboxylase alpha chain, partial [Nocardioidaceae bacterium]|nr:propionyl-CoA carboxylase alpha chain [Nocardioidaceae bacterium]
FLERYLVRSRHVEIQILGDAHGGLVHLGERECSIQRRHQKIIEESPSPVVDPALRERMGAAAVALAKTLGYSSAGTVEFLVDDNAGPDGERSFYFLEVNTRLQVEHPVTEAVTGLDIVREQLRVAMGEPLGYTQADIVFTGHAIEARLYAEDPVAGFLPATGTLVGWKPASEPPARWDSAVEAGGVIGTQFDPMLAKIIVHAPNRHEAAGRLALVLERSLIAGVVTNRDFLVNTLRTPEFVSGDTTTDFIDRVDPPRRAALRAEVARDAAISAALWQQQNRRSTATVLAFMPSGWRNTPFPLQIAMFTSDGDSVTISYRRRRDGTFTIGDDGCVARVLAWGGTSIDVEIGGHRFRSTIVESGDRLYVATPDGQTELSVCPLFPTLEPAAPSGGVVAPMPGIVLDVRVVSDQRVEAGETLAVMEAMKMEHRLIAPTPGRVTEVRVAIGDRLEAGAILFVVEEETT